MKKPKYLFYATILDAFQGLLSSSEIYQDYWGSSEEPSKTEDEFEKEQFQSLIDRINRVPFDSEDADRGTVFNEIVDCIIENRNSIKADIRSDKEQSLIFAGYNNRTFTFPVSLCMEFANYFKGATTQFYVEAPLETKYGTILLYGFIDELMPHSIHDIKTTGKYKVGKFRNNWQHVAYPYCLNETGNKVTDFEYNVVMLGKTGGYSTFTEYYRYNHEVDKLRLIEHCEKFIEFLETNKSLITDLKIFNLNQ